MKVSLDNVHHEHQLSCTTYHFPQKAPKNGSLKVKASEEGRVVPFFLEISNQPLLVLQPYKSKLLKEPLVLYVAFINRLGAFRGTQFELLDLGLYWA